MILYLVNLGATFGVFSAVCWRLYETRRPTDHTFGCIGQWLLWLVVHLCIGIPMLVILGDQWAGRQVPPFHIVVLKCGLAVLLLAPWRRRENDR